MARRYDYPMLMRIVAILFSMSALAESLVGVSPHRRRLVLQVLRPAEAVACAFVAGEGGGRGLQDLPSPPFDGDGPEDALRLALCFRTLALALGAVLAQFAAFGASPAQAHCPFYQRAARLALHQPVFASATILDTS